MKRQVDSGHSAHSFQGDAFLVDAGKLEAGL